MRRTLGAGFGPGLAALLAGPSAQAAAVCALHRAATAGESQARHLPVHARRTLPCRYVRSQAGAGQVRGAAAGLRGSAHGTADRRTAARRRSSSRSTGRAAIEVSELLPQLGSVIDEICVIRSMYTFNPTHMPARSLFHSGSILATRPSTGRVDFLRAGNGERKSARIRGAESRIAARPCIRARASCRREHQGVTFTDAEVEPEKMIPNLRNTQLDPQAQRKQLDALQALNRELQRVLRRGPVSRRPHQIHGSGLPHAV